MGALLPVIILIHGRWVVTGSGSVTGRRLHGHIPFARFFYTVSYTSRAPPRPPAMIFATFSGAKNCAGEIVPAFMRAKSSIAA